MSSGWSTGRVSVDSLEVTSPPSVRTAVATAVLTTSPAFTSAPVTTYDAVQVTESPGSTGPPGQVTATGTASSFGSDTATSDSVTLPVFVTSNV